MFDTYARARPATSRLRLLDMLDAGEIDTRVVAEMALMWLSESDVKEMMLANDLVEDDEDDGQPDEAQEWHDYDADC